MKQFIIPALLLFALHSSAQWNWQNALPQGNQLNSVYFTNPSTGVAVGDGGTIIMTHDAGLTWRSIYSGTGNNLLSVYFTSESDGYASGSFGTILSTTDGGITWSLVSSGTADHLYSIDFTSITTGFIAGGNPTSGNAGVILRTTDGGASWQTVLSGFNLYSIHFLTNKKGFATGELGIRCSTTDGGATWEWSQPDPMITMNALSFTDSLTGYSAGASSAILKTADGGVHWSLLKEPGWQYPSLYGLFFTNPTTGIAVGADGIIMRTMDSGATWSTVYASPWLTTLRSVFFTDESTGYAVGDYGDILKTTDGGTTWNSISRRVATTTLNSVCFPDKNTGYAAGNDGYILRTLNGGKTWSRSLTWTSKNLAELFFLNADTGYAVGHQGGGVILKTVNGGDTWTIQEFPSSLLSVCFPTPMTGYASGSSVLYKTVDAGESWTLMPPMTSELASALCFTGENTGYVIIQGEIWKTTDGATSWNKVYSAPATWPWPMADIDFPAPDTGFAVGLLEGIIKTVDGGVTWTFTEGGNRDHDLGAVTFTDTRHGWAVASNSSLGADDRIILRTTDGGASWSSFSCGTNYPLHAVCFVDNHTGYIAGEKGIILGTGTGGEPLLSPPYRIVPAPSGSTTFDVFCDTAWNASSDALWCTVTPSGSGNGTLQVSYTRNSTTSFRIANLILVTDRSDTMTVQVSQSGITDSLAVSPAQQTVSAANGNIDFSVTAGGPWTAVCDAAWCQVPATGGGSGPLTATYEENNSLTARQARITITLTYSPQVKQVVNLIQDKPNGIDVLSSDAIFRIEPNPTNGVFVIVTGDQSERNMEISILDQVGNILSTALYNKRKKCQVDLSGEPAGCYYIKIKSGDRTEVRKLILLH